MELSLFTDYVCLYGQSQGIYKNKTITSEKKFSKVTRYKTNIQKPVVCLYTNNEYIETEIKKMFNFSSHKEKKTEIPLHTCQNSYKSPNASKYTEKLDPSHITGGNVKWCTLEDVWQFLTKLNIHLSQRNKSICSHKNL